MNIKSQQADNNVFAQVIDYLDSVEFSYDLFEGESALQVIFQGDNGEWICCAYVDEEIKQLCFYSVIPFSISQQQRMNIAEFITRANYGMAAGHFELDFDDGELRYKTSTEFEENHVAKTIIHRMFYVNVFTMDYYLPLITAINNGEISPVQALKVVRETIETEEQKN